MATTQEPPTDGLVDLGRQVADDAARLVRAEIGLAKAQVLEAVIRFAVGGGLLLTAAIMGLFFLVFTIGTLVEGVDPLDSWPLYVAIGALVAGAAMAGIARVLPRWIAWLAWTLAGLGAAAGLTGFVWFYVAAIIGGNGEVARRGWAIAATAFFGIMICLAGAGAFFVVRGVGEAKSTVDDIKEDAAWVTQLTKRAKSGS